MAHCFCHFRAIRRAGSLEASIGTVPAESGSSASAAFAVFASITAAVIAVRKVWWIFIVMRVIRSREPFHRLGFSTEWIAGTLETAKRSQLVSALVLFLLAAVATATIADRDPIIGWGYSLGIFLCCLYWAV